MLARERGDVVEIAYAPGRVPRPQFRIELRVAGGGVQATLTKRAVEEQHPTGVSTRAVPAISPWVTFHGTIWTILIATTASAWATGQVSAPASRTSGGNKFGRRVRSRQATMLLKASGSRSVGCHVSSGSAVLKHTACSPVPLAISNTCADRGKVSRNTCRIGSRLRTAAGADLAARCISVATPSVEDSLVHLARSRSRAVHRLVVN